MRAGFRACSGLAESGVGGGGRGAEGEGWIPNPSTWRRGGGGRQPIARGRRGEGREPARAPLGRVPRPCARVPCRHRHQRLPESPAAAPPGRARAGQSWGGCSAVATATRKARSPVSVPFAPPPPPPPALRSGAPQPQLLQWSGKWPLGAMSSRLSAPRFVLSCLSSLEFAQAPWLANAGGRDGCCAAVRAHMFI